MGMHAILYGDIASASALYQDAVETLLQAASAPCPQCGSSHEYTESDVWQDYDNNISVTCHNCEDYTWLVDTGGR